ncbi:MAG: hemagglutinin protein [Frankiales bacterium]|nr:hemagglutinin protein [Frankiales bacterium]
MLRRTRFRATLLAASAVALTVGLVSAPSSQAAAKLPPATKGLVTQAFTAVPYVKPVEPVIPSIRYYLLGARPAAGFTRTAPAGSSDQTQATNVLSSGGPDSASDGSNAYWTGSYHGTLKGTVKISWFWSTHDPLAAANNLQVGLIADPGTKDQKVIGQASSGVTNADGTAHVYTVKVDVDGTVKSRLQLVGAPQYVDAGQDLTAHYGSATAPSYLEIPLGTAPPATYPTTKVVKDTAPLLLAATKIGRKASEPTIGVTKAGNAFITAADFDGVSPATPRTLIYSSSDGNTSWHNVSPLIAGQPTPPTTLDPYLYVDPDTGRIFNDDLTVGCSFLQWSDDEGKTWQVGNPLACEAPVDDHQTVVTGKPRGGLFTIGYPKIVYYCVNKVADVQCARSLDGGRTFTFTGSYPFLGVDPGNGEEGTGLQVCGSLHGHIITDPDGRLFLPKGHCGQGWVAISEDSGTTWKDVKVNKMAVASHQTSIASDTAGNLYYVWFGADDLLPYMSVSRDHGQTWGKAYLIAPPGVAAVNFPSIDAQEPGHVAISFPGSTSREASGARPWNYYVEVSTNALSQPPTFHSSTVAPAKDPIHRGPCLDRCAGMYDFIDVVIAPKSKALWASAVDTCTSVKCIAAAGPTLKSGEGANDAQGLAIRQLSGAGLNGLGEKTPITVVTTPVAKTPTASGPRGGLAATGLGTGLPLAAGFLLALGLLLRRRPA